MKTIKFLFLSVATMLVVVTSCKGGSKSSYEAGEQSVELKADGVSGESADLISIKDGMYTLNFTNSYEGDDDKYGRQNFSIKVKLVLQKPFDETTEPDSAYLYDCELALIDKNGVVLTTLDLGQGSLDSDTKKELKKFLMSEAGTEKEFLFTTHMSNAEHAFSCIEKAASFKIVKLKIEKEKTYSVAASENTGSDAEESADVSESGDEASASGSEDWDSLLKSYEEYVDKYISLTKKASKGDMSAMAEYPELMEKAQGFADKMENAKDDMSASQWARYMKITNKMAQAAAAMR